MPIVMAGEIATFLRLELNPSEIPALLRKHAERYPGVEGLERRGADLVRASFPPDEAATFLKAVCEWGGGDRFVGRALRDNAPWEIAAAMRSAVELAREGKAGEGVEALRELKYLGQSFASKQLRFLAPDCAVILDDVIRTRLGYAEKLSGYSEFLADCQRILEIATGRGIEARPGTRLRVAEVEGAVFAKIKGY